VNVPSPQAVQARSIVVVPAVLTYSPATQFDQTRQLSAFAVALNVPSPQAVQTRSAVSLPAPETYWPATHSVQGMQAVDGSPS
jgi:hypothetical protein